MEQTVNHSQPGRTDTLSTEERRDIYLRYFVQKDSMALIAADIDRTRLTISRCIQAQQQALCAIRSDLDGGRPQPKIHYARYMEQVLTITSKQSRQRQKAESTTTAEDFIQAWWRRQRRESKDKRWMDAKKLYTDFCSARKEPISYKSFTRAMKRIIGEANMMAPGRPKRRLRGRPKGSGGTKSSTPPRASEVK